MKESEGWWKQPPFATSPLTDVYPVSVAIDDDDDVILI